MKLRIALFLLLALAVPAASAQTNALFSGDLMTNGTPQAADPGYGKWDLTLGSAGTVVQGHAMYGLDVSLSTDPFKALPDLWVGASQSAYWQPQFAGSTDLDADWLFTLPVKNTYLSLGCSGGVVYSDQELVDHGAHSLFWRTGPEGELQWFATDSSFLYGSCNYDLQSAGPGGFRFSFGIGVEF